MPTPGDLVLIDHRASVQFAGERALWLRVTSVDDRPTYDGWVWLTGYSINQATGEAMARREVFVQIAGLRVQPRTTGSTTTAGTPPRRNAGPTRRGRGV
ncbi:hypothetical protein [Micromonospora sp. WMMD987]|uniref:hypothetical protein n=1 Tax=Micromonospora sp. WMMD987 TaxID=3016089 RepID=UPI00249B7A79|nr:hypothetical protein [Micromonospora sp. WMMD987]WFE95933.1 hypothetical protein O7612_03110 [Micromonospora sp. WMMD987]